MHRLLLAICIASLLVACSKKEGTESLPSSTSAPVEVSKPIPVVDEVKIGALKLGKTIDAKNKVAADTVGFTKSDTVYASVDLIGKGKATLKAKWTHHHGEKETIIDESEQTIEGSGTETVEFHISNLKATGDYKVEVKLNDTLSETKSFSVSE